MTILSIDTSHPVGSVALLAEDGTCEMLSLERSSSHLVELGKAVDTLMKGAGVAMGDIDRVALVIGPGSFTGLRIGMAYVKGFYAAVTPEIVAMTSLELLALGGVEGDFAISPMIDARRNEIYAALYEPRELGSGREPASGPARGGGNSPRSDLIERIAPRALPPKNYIGSLDKHPTVFVGSGALRYRNEIIDVFGDSARFADEPRHLPDTRILCEIAGGLDPLEPNEVVTLEPFYIRPSDAKLKPLRSIRTHD